MFATHIKVLGGCHVARGPDRTGPGLLYAEIKLFSNIKVLLTNLDNLRTRPSLTIVGNLPSLFTVLEIFKPANTQSFKSFDHRPLMARVGYLYLETIQAAFMGVRRGGQEGALDPPWPAKIVCF